MTFERRAALLLAALLLRARGAGRPEDVAPVTRRAWAVVITRSWWHGARRVPRLFAPLA